MTHEDADETTVVTQLPSSTPGKRLFRVTEGRHTCLIERDSRPERPTPGYGVILSATEAARESFRQLAQQPETRKPMS